MGRAFQQTKRLGTEFILNEAKALRRADDGALYVRLRDGTEIGARSVVLATGVQFRQIGDVPNLTALEGKGVYYGSALTEAPLTKAGEHVYIVGGANSAGQAAVKYSELVGPKGEVVMLTRSPLNKSMSDYLIDQINARPNIRVETGAVLDSVVGSGKLEAVSFSNHLTGSKATEAANSMFIFIGSAPKTHWLSEQLAVDSQGFLQTGLQAKQRSAWNLDRDPMPNETSIPGVFTAGDVHAGTAKRIITAAGEGANTVSQIHQWLGTPNAAKPMYDRGPLAANIAPKITADIPALWPAQSLNPTLGILRMSGLWGQSERTRAGAF
jgi:thioredoxin reductase (NADPH)